jgi:hypothetical protein
MVVAIKAIACELPARLGLPFSRLHVPDIQAEVISRGLVASISDMSRWRWLEEDAVKPWTHRSWILWLDQGLLGAGHVGISPPTARGRETRLTHAGLLTPDPPNCG